MTEIKFKKDGEWIRWDGSDVEEYMLCNWETKINEIVNRNELIKRYPEQWKFIRFNYNP